MHSREPMTVWRRAVDAASTWPQEVIRLRVLVGDRKEERVQPGHHESNKSNNQDGTVSK